MSLDLAELQGENQRLSQEGGGDFLENFVKMPEGNGHVLLRLMPPAPAGTFGREKNRFYTETRIHRVNNKSLHCPKTLQDGKWVGECPICRYYNWLWQESDKKPKAEADAMQAKARSIKPIERYYYNVLVRQQLNEKTGEMEKNVGPKILSIGKTLHKMIIRAIVGDETLDEPALGDVTNAKTGRDFKLVKEMVKSGGDSFPNYSKSKFTDPSPLGSPEDVAKYMEGLHDLTSLRTIKEADELKHELKVHLGIVQDTTAAGGFDPREFQKSDGSESVVVTEEPAVAPKTTTAAKKKTTPAPAEEEVAAVEDSGTDDSMADEDFLEQLKAMQ